jgi:uncharacterized protein YlxW (UPF0749 family)
MTPEVLISVVAAASSLATAVLVNLFSRRNRQALTDHTAVETMELVVRNLRQELDRERAYRQELETRVRHLENLIQQLHGDGK